jgi:hypothetical protein
MRFYIEEQRDRSGALCARKRKRSKVKKEEKVKGQKRGKGQ